MSGCRAPPGRASGWVLASSRLSGLARPSDALTAPPTGTVYHWEDPDPRLLDTPASPEAADPADPTGSFRLSQGDVYKELRLRGYDYGPHFQGVLEASLEGGHCLPTPAMCLPRPQPGERGRGEGPRGLAGALLALTPLRTGDSGRLLWQDNWVTFLDSMLQMSILGTRQRSLRLPTRFAAIRIDPAAHRQKVQGLPGEAPGR